MTAKTRTTIYIDNDIMDYIKTKIEDHTFANISHAVELSVARYREQERADRERKGGERDRARRYGIDMVPPAMVVQIVSGTVLFYAHILVAQGFGYGCQERGSRPIRGGPDCRAPV